jgi:hypothetical protein
VLHPRQVDVEQVDLPVAGERLAVRADQHRGVAHARVARDVLGQAAEQQRDAEPSRQIGHPPYPRSVDCLRLGHRLALRAQEGEVLGQADERGAAAGGLLDECFGRGQVPLDVGGRGHLHDGSDGALGRAHRFARLRRGSGRAGRRRTAGGRPEAHA